MELDVPASLQATRPAPELERPAAGDPRFRRLLVPLDGSDLAEAVLPFVARLAAPRATAVVVLQAVPTTIPVMAMDAPPPPSVFEADERARVEAVRYVEGVAARLRRDGFDAEASVRVGDAAPLILEAARELSVDLIAMTTHGRTGLGRLVFGSVAEQVLRQAPVPVFLVRVSEEQAARRAA